MSLYLGTTEITNIDNLVPQTGLDITDIWFSSMNVYTVWQIYEGTLPATINANGSDLRQYQVWGNTGGVGDKTVNYFDAEISIGSISNTNGADDDTTNVRLRSGFLSTALSAEVYTINASGIDDVVIYKYDAEKNFIGVETSPSYWGALPRAFTLSSVMFVRFVFRHSDNRRCYVSDISNIMLTPGTTQPETFVPFGHEVDISTSDGTSNTTTTIYIGDEPLEKDEYVDYTAQKVYRRTVNKYDIATQTKNSGLSVNGSTASSTTSSRSDYIAVAPEATYTKKANAVDTVKRITQFFDSNKRFLSNTTPDSSEMPQTFTTPNNCAFVRIAYPIGSTQVMLVEGSDAPAQFIPYLQPIDPPVPLPALPTCEGTTVIDYAGQSGEPEKVLLKYRKEGF